MKTYEVSLSRVIPAPAARIYALLSDYREGHPSLLPPRYFRKLNVQEGGQGAGTVIAVHMQVMGVKAQYLLEVTEPEPGRILREADEAAGMRTDFIVEPLKDGTYSRLTIFTTARSAGGFKGWLERKMNPGIMRGIYRQILDKLETKMSEPEKAQAS